MRSRRAFFFLGPQGEVIQRYELNRSRVRHPTSVLNLAMIPRATIRIAIAWIERCRNKRQATLQGFYDVMSSKNHRRAFALVTAEKPSWSPP